MSDPLADSSTRLGQLLQQIMKETGPAKYDELCAEIWRVLSERERLVGQPSFPDKTGPVNALAPWCGKAIFIVNRRSASGKLQVKSRSNEQRMTERGVSHVNH